MSIRNLFSDNNYTIKCRNLECSELIAGDIVNPTGIIDDLYTDRIRSGQTQNIVMNLSTGNTVFHSDILPETTVTQNVGSIAKRWNTVHSQTIENTGSISTGGALSCGDLAVSGSSIFEQDVLPFDDGVQNLGSGVKRWNVIYSDTLSNSGNASLHSLNVTNSATINVNCVTQGLQFSTGGNQQILNTYRHINVAGGLNVYGAVNPGSGVTVDYTGTRIGDFVCLTIDAFPQEVCFSNTNPITFGVVDEYFRPGAGGAMPPSNKVVATTLQVQTDTGTIIMGECVISHDGTIKVYAGLTNSSFFTLGHNIRVGYSGTSFFTISYNI